MPSCVACPHHITVNAFRPRVATVVPVTVGITMADTQPTEVEGTQAATLPDTLPDTEQEEATQALPTVDALPDTLAATQELGTDDVLPETLEVHGVVGFRGCHTQPAIFGHL